MKRPVILLILATLFFLPSLGEGTGVGSLHRFAGYNVRFVNTSNGDTGARSWSERGPYVLKLIKDYDFDIVGMEEVTGRNGNTKACLNPLTNKSQLEEITEGLADYGIIQYERSGLHTVQGYSFNVIAYKKSKYELIETDCFWLSPTPGKPSGGWDKSGNYNIWRTLGWAHFRVKETGETFYFCVAHVNYGGSADGPKSGACAEKMMRQIAGEEPLILVGDFNMRRSDHEQAYRSWASWLNDAALRAETNLCLPVENGQTTLTTTEWTPITNPTANGSEFDYSFYRHMRVRERHIITENFGRGINPSDHYPVLVCCELAPEEGSRSHDVRQGESIADALADAQLDDTIRVEAGVYREQLFPDNSVTIVGGYNSDFTAVEGQTVVDAEDYEGSAVSIPHYYNLDLRNITIRNVSSTQQDYDGAVNTNGYRLRLTNVLFDHCQASLSGGGVVSTCEQTTLRQCRFAACSATEQGGGVLINVADSLTMFGCTFEACSAKSGSAMMVAGARTTRIYGSSFFGNNSTQQGTLALAPCTYADACGIVNCTFAGNRVDSPAGLATLTRKYGGAAVNVQMQSGARFGMAHCTVAGNHATIASTKTDSYGSAALTLFNVQATLMNNIVAGNTSDNGIGDLMADESVTLSKEQYNVFTCAETVNITPKNNDFIANSESEGHQALAQMLYGKLDGDDCFVATSYQAEGPVKVVPLVSSSYAGKDTAVLSSFLRLVEGSLNLDMDDNGQVGSYLGRDQRGVERNAKSVPGACELMEVTDLQYVVAEPQPSPQSVYDLQGRRLNAIPQHGLFIINGKKMIK